MQDADVRAYCVFDGKFRVPAKFEETQRRKEQQVLVVRRQAIEQKRQERLNRVNEVLSELKDDVEEEDQENLKVVEPVKKKSKRRERLRRVARVLAELKNDVGEDQLDLEVVTTPQRQESITRVTQVITALKDEVEAGQSQERLARVTQVLTALKDGIGVGRVDSEVVRSVTATLTTKRDEPASRTALALEEELRAFLELPAEAHAYPFTFKQIKSVTITETLDPERDNIAEPHKGEAESENAKPDDLLVADFPPIIGLPSEKTDTVTDVSSPSSPSLDSTIVNELEKLALLELLDHTALIITPTPVPQTDVLPAENPSLRQRQLNTAERQFLGEIASLTENIANQEEQLPTIMDSIMKVREESVEMLRSFDKRACPPTTGTYEESIEILEAMGVPCIRIDGPYEGEAVAASMVLRGRADYVISEDTDVLAFGAVLLSGVTKRSEPITVIAGGEIPEQLNLNRESFIDLVVILGTDFNKRVPGIGPERGLQFIRKHQSIERIMENEPLYQKGLATLNSVMGSLPWLEIVERSREIFKTPPPVPSIEEGKKDDKKVVQVLEKYRLGSVILDEYEWSNALAGNYFGDNPSASMLNRDI